MVSKSPGVTRRTWEIGGSPPSTTGKSSMNVVRIAPPPGQGEVVGRGGHGDAQDSDKVVHRPVVEARDGLRILGAVRGRGEAECGDSLGLEARIHGAEFPEAQDHERRSDLCRDDAGVACRMLRPADRPAVSAVPEREEHRAGNLPPAEEAGAPAVRSGTSPLRRDHV